MSWITKALQRKWYATDYSPVLWPLRPLASLYYLAALINKSTSLNKQASHLVPIWVVGNISVGGTGKTPVTLALVKYCQEKNIQVGIVSRGYGGSEGGHQPFILDHDSTAQQAGDEPLLMYQRLSCPVVIATKRNDAVTALLAKHPETQLILSDDGLQHYAMPRQLEIVVIDGARGLGNQQLLPAGPLRESPKRLSSVDIIIHNGSMHDNCRAALSPYNEKTYPMELSPAPLIPLQQSAQFAVPVKGDTVHAIAGIGHPQRFFNSLKAQGFSVIEHSFTDHYAYQRQDLQFNDSLAIIMTEKDAVKCASLSTSLACFYQPVDATFNTKFYAQIDTWLSAL